MTGNDHRQGATKRTHLLLMLFCLSTPLFKQKSAGISDVSVTQVKNDVPRTFANVHDRFNPDMPGNLQPVLERLLLASAVLQEEYGFSLLFPTLGRPFLAHFSALCHPPHAELRYSVRMLIGCGRGAWNLMVCPIRVYFAGTAGRTGKGSTTSPASRCSSSRTKRRYLPSRQLRHSFLASISCVAPSSSPPHTCGLA